MKLQLIGNIESPEEKMYLEEVQELITKYNKLVDDEIKAKEQELMQV